MLYSEYTSLSQLPTFSSFNRDTILLPLAEVGTADSAPAICKIVGNQSKLVTDCETRNPGLTVPGHLIIPGTLSELSYRFGRYLPFMFSVEGGNVFVAQIPFPLCQIPLC